MRMVYDKTGVKEGACLTLHASLRYGCVYCVCACCWHIAATVRFPQQYDITAVAVSLVVINLEAHTRTPMPKHTQFKARVLVKH